MKALLILDMQNDFLPGGALPIPEGDEIIDLINELQKKFTLIVASKDWHPLHHVSFAVEHGKEPGEEILLEKGRQILWPVHCVQEQEGAAFAPSLEVENISKTFFKGVDPTIDSYSAFYDNAHERSTGLAEFLKEREISDLYIVGLATDYCVKYSVLDGLRAGFRVNVIIDGCRGIEREPGDVAAAIEEMRRGGASIITSSDL